MANPGGLAWGSLGGRALKKKIKNLTGKKKPLENTKREIEREICAHHLFVWMIHEDLSRILNLSSFNLLLGCEGDKVSGIRDFW